MIPSQEQTSVSFFGAYMRQLPRIALPDGFSPLNVNRLLYIRLDGIGDAVIANGLLEKLPEIFPNAKISVVCDQASAAIYEACPLVEDVTPLKKFGLANPQYFKGAVRLLAARKADAALHAVASPAAWTAALALSRRVPVIGFEADAANMFQADRDAYNEKLSLKIAVNDASSLELEKYEAMLAQLGAPAAKLHPRLWLAERHHAAAQELQRKHGLVPERTIALFSKGFSSPWYSMFGHALLNIRLNRGWSVVALGAAADFQFNEENLLLPRANGVSCVNLSGTDLLDIAALLAQCRLAVGVDTSLAHIACALHVPQVIALAGGYFGRFMPYHQTTAAVCLPLECYNCGYKCPYEQPYCISGLRPEILAEAIESALDSASAPAGCGGSVLMQGPLTCKAAPGQPRWRGPARFIQQRENGERPVVFRVSSTPAKAF